MKTEDQNNQKNLSANCCDSVTDVPTLMHCLQKILEDSSEFISPSPLVDRSWQDNFIIETIPANSKVLDLGCGTGVLLNKLMKQKQVFGQGIEIDPESVMTCIERGVPVVQNDLDKGLREIPDKLFDYAVCEETLQTLHRPMLILCEMLRVAKYVIISFPNFAYWRVRADLALRGRMPITSRLSHTWYDTPNIHLFCLQDFLDWIDKNNVKIIQAYVLSDGQVRPMDKDDNMRAEEVMMLLGTNS